MRNFILLLCATILFPFCQKGKTDREKMDEYVAAQNLHGQYTSTGLYYTVDVPGTGGNPKVSNTVKVEYSGYLLDGTKFDGTASGSPIEFGLSQVILGWQEGIPQFQKGGKGKLLIPSALGYGSRSAGSIPANSVLVFDVYLVDWH
ncbi:MAG: FKBP-type peptidyl-prolyl cis-trans isomerase [Bacteroidetes bacterium]|nr:FKBP-type peptidyl-prolyl cis-trans isomerase [Bacteroidota bacterium]